MANIKVSEMTEATTFDDGDYTMIVQSNQSKKITKENLLDSVEDEITNVNTTIGDLTELETATKTSVVNSINEINSTRLKKLWENEAPTSDFSSQNIILSSDDYDYLIIYWLNYKTTQRLCSTSTLKGYGAYLNLASDYNIGGANYNVASYVREFVRNSDTSYSFYDCYIRYGNSTTRPVNNSNIVPVAIYGGKF